MKPRTIAALLLAVVLTLAPTPTVAPAAAAAQRAGTLSTLWLPPLDDHLRITEHFALPNGPYRAGHRGVDLTGAAGATVRAPTAGTVSFVGVVVDRPVLSLRVDARTMVSFEPIESELSVGERVPRGAALGEIAAGGHCSERCLHLGVRVDDEYVNPLRYLRPRPVLLPW